MSLNSSISLNISPSQILPLLNRYRGITVTLLTMAVIAYTGYQISQVTNVQPSQGYIAEKQASTKAAGLHVNRKVLAALHQLEPSSDTSVPIVLGSRNPFSLN